jgi:pimeloyl-ACP methyl ester carboxylesterase
MAGLMISGAPPVGRSPQEIQEGFRPNPHIGLAGKPDFTKEDVEMFVRATAGEPVDEVMRSAIVRTDGRARAMMFASLFAGKASDERALAINSPVPLAVVNGADDPLVNVDYVSSLPYRNLWDQHCYVLRGAAHAPFLQVAETFNRILFRFVGEMAQRGISGRGAGTAAA